MTTAGASIRENGKTFDRSTEKGRANEQALDGIAEAALTAAQHAFGLAKVARMDQLPEKERLNPERVVEDLRHGGKEAFYEADVAAIVERVSGLTQTGDVIVVFSNGGFDNIHARLLEALAAKA